MVKTYGSADSPQAVFQHVFAIIFLIPSNKQFFRRLRQFFDVRFASQRFTACCEFFRIDDVDRPARARVLGAFADIVHLLARLEIFAEAAVERIVGAAKQVDMKRHD